MREALRLFSPALVLVLLSFQTIGTTAAGNYAPGTRIGDTVSYTVTSANQIHDPLVGPFTNASSIDMSVVAVSGQNVIVNQLWRYTNGTEDRTITLSGNVESGNGNYTIFGGVRWFIAGGLRVHDPLRFLPNANITSTLSARYAGASRTVNLWNVTESDGAFERESHVWDRNRGLLLELSYLVSYPGLGSALLNIQAIQTNIPYPDFTVAASRSTVNVTSNIEGTSTITLNSRNGFNDTVRLNLVSSRGLTCSLTPSSLLVKASATSTLKCTAPPGSYVATLNATAGTLFHTTQVTFHSVALTPQTEGTSGLDPTVLYALIGAGLAAGVLVGFVVLRKKRIRRVSYAKDKDGSRTVNSPRSARHRKRLALLNFEGCRSISSN